MKSNKLHCLAIALIAAPAFGGAGIVPGAIGPVSVSDPSNAPSLGAGLVMPLTAEQRAGESAAVERRHDALIRAGIDAVEKQGKTRLEPLLRRLLNQGTAAEKATYAGVVGDTYRFPERISLAAEDARFRFAFDRGIECRATRCIQSGTEQVCNNRSICRVVCQGAAGGAGGAIGGATGAAIGTIGGGEVCSQVCEIVPECRTVSVCYQYEYSGAGCF